LGLACRRPGKRRAGHQFGRLLIGVTVLSRWHQDNHCLPVGAHLRGDQDGGRRRGVGAVVTAQHDDAKRHSGNGANELRDDAAGE
jgi:hypothetical protein